MKYLCLVYMAEHTLADVPDSECLAYGESPESGVTSPRKRCKRRRRQRPCVSATARCR